MRTNRDASSRRSPLSVSSKVVEPPEVSEVAEAVVVPVAAVVAVGWGKCCIAGASEIQIDAAGRKAKVNGRTLTHEDTISIDISLPLMLRPLKGQLEGKIDEYYEKYFGTG